MALGSGKTNVLLNLTSKLTSNLTIKHQSSNVDKIYSYVKDPFESKCQLLIKRRVKGGIKHETSQRHS